MFDLEKAFASDEDKTLNGVWHEVNYGDVKFSLKVAASNNPAYKRYLRRAMSTNRFAARTTSEASMKAMEALHVKAMAHTILVDWKGVVINGESKPYTAELGERVLGMDRFRDLVEDLAGDFEAYSAASDEEQEKN